MTSTLLASPVADMHIRICSVFEEHRTTESTEPEGSTLSSSTCLPALDFVKLVNLFVRSPGYLELCFWKAILLSPVVEDKYELHCLCIRSKKLKKIWNTLYPLVYLVGRVEGGMVHFSVMSAKQKNQTRLRW